MLVRPLSFVCYFLLPLCYMWAQGTNITVTGNTNVPLGSLTEAATVTWNAAGYNNIEVHVGSPTGGLLDAGAQTGGATTGNWVTNGMTFFLVNAYTGKWLASTTAHFNTTANGSSVQFYASTNPIPAPSGSSYGATTVYFVAPGYTNLEVHVGSPTGPLFTRGNYSGQATTGNWVTNDTTFYLVDANTGTTLSSLATNIAPQDTLDPNPTAGDGVPVINGPDGASSAAMWYLGGSYSIDGYSTQAAVALQSPTPSTANPTISWSTDSPSRLAVYPSSDLKSATLVALGPSGFQAGYDTHVTVSYNGTKSKPFPVFINTPFSMTTRQSGNYCNGSGCGCQAFQYTNSTYGYVDLVLHSLADLNGVTMSPITTHETLENVQITNGNGNYPAEGTWVPGNSDEWNNYNQLLDYFAVCSNTPLPPAGTPMLNETQKFWSGGPQGTRFTGECVEVGKIVLYSDQGVLTVKETPVTNQADCSAGKFYN